MRHRVAGRKLSRHTQHRKLMFRNMLVSLLEHERITTTLAKAKELRGFADGIITLGKKDSLHARRQAFDLLRDRESVKKLFEVIAPKMKDREGGYTRIYRTGWRQGDAAPMSMIELVSFAHPEVKKKKSAVKKAKEAIEKAVPKKKEKEEKKEKGKEKKPKKEGKEAAKEKKEKPKKKSSEEKTK